MRNTLLLVLFGFLAIPMLHGQSKPFVCGTVGELAHQLSLRTQYNKRVLESRGPASYREPILLPVKFHLVAKSDGSGRVSEKAILDKLCEINDRFSPADIQFYIDGGFNYLDNSSVYDNAASAQGGIMNLEKDSDAINVWVVGNPGSANTSVTPAGFYSPFYDWVVVRNVDITSNNDYTLTHELGHFLGLLHPYNGWDTEPYDPEVHGNPVNLTFAPGTSRHDYSSRVRVEFQDGSNCNSAGDFLCDTRADYFFLNLDDILTCEFSTVVMDPQGDTITTDPLVYMNNFFGCDPDDMFFTSSQQEMMLVDAQSPARAYIRRNTPPEAASITESPELLFPINGEASTTGAEVEFQWSGVEGADRYLIEVDRIPSFSLFPVRKIVTSTSTSIDGLDVGRRYFWRVRPFNRANTCAPATASESFEVGAATAVQEPEFVEQWSVVPNPVASGRQLLLRLRSEKNFAAQVNIYSIDGKRRLSESVQFNAGTNEMALATNDLPAGSYLLSVLSEEGMLNRRIVILD
ncbi:MAG: zinc-dependent metalloprotease [Saprospiraceae bacterium]|nr:zinc-dependent metalloprotease [Saprospiraceae bacterium]